MNICWSDDIGHVVFFVTLKKWTITMTEEQALYEVSPNKDIKGCIIRIKLIDGSKINGRVNLNGNDDFDRLSDLVASGQKPFLVFFDATVYEVGIENPVKYKTLFVNKNHIIWASLKKRQRKNTIKRYGPNKLTIEEMRSNKEDAQKAGHSHYFTNRLCKYGHLAPRTTGNSTCVQCASAHSSKYQKEKKP